MYVEGKLSPTRKNILAPGAIGVYSGGGIYNPAQIMRDDSVKSSTTKADKKLTSVANKQFGEMPISELQELIALTVPDPKQAEKVWDPLAVAASIGQFAKLKGHQTGYVYVDRDRGLKATRRETQGILDSGEAGLVPDDKITLFLLRTDDKVPSNPAWWPQIRFPNGRYAFAFAI